MPFPPARVPQQDLPSDGVLAVRGPPSIYITPPQTYMLFILNGDVYSRGRWVRVPRPANGTALNPMPL